MKQGSIKHYRQSGDSKVPDSLPYGELAVAKDGTLYVGNESNAPVAQEPAFEKNSAFNKNFGKASGTVCVGNDPRLSDARRASNISMQLSGSDLIITFT